MLNIVTVAVALFTLHTVLDAATMLYVTALPEPPPVATGLIAKLAPAATANTRLAGLCTGKLIV